MRATRILGWTALAALVVALPALAQIFTTASPAAPIPDNSVGVFTACQTITVAGPLIITDVNVEVTVAHTFIGDLTYRLQNPGATSTLLVMNRPARTTAGFGNSANLAVANPLTYNDTAASGRSAEDAGENPVNTACPDTSIVGSAGCPPDNYIPAPGSAGDTPIPPAGTNLAQYNTQDAAGIWTLCVADSAAADTGTLSSWRLGFNGSLPVALESFTIE